MTDQTMPASGGSYIREADGTLRLIEEPTADGYRLAARDAAALAPVEAPVEGAVQEGAPAAFKSRRAPLPKPDVKES